MLMMMRISRRTLFGFLATAAIATRLRAAATPAKLVLKTPEGRAIDVYVWRAGRQRRGIIAFSHGALSAPNKYEPLIGPWVAAGYDVLAPLHVDSTDHPDTKHYTGFMSWRARIEDMRALSAHIGHHAYIAAGHSYGGLVALTLGGASAVVPDGLTEPLGDSRVKAVIAFSPPGPAKGLIEMAGYATLKVPAIIETGDKDVPPGSNDWHQHLAAYDAAASAGNRYALVLEGVDHYFGGVICRPDLPGPKQSTQFAIASNLSVLFLNAYGAGDRNARAALDAGLTDEGPIKLSRK